MDQINKIIETIINEDKHNPSYNINDHIIAQFSEDDNYYRAKIESYSSSSNFYTVYFLDYGNLDENVPIEHLYSYSTELEQIEPQVHKYLLDNITSETWDNIVRSFVEAKLNDTIEFYITDEDRSVIHMKFDNENIKQSESMKTYTVNICAIDNDCFYIHTVPDGNLHAGEMEENLRLCNKEHKDQWAVQDACIVSNEENQYYRGEILRMDDKKYDVKCIDYGNTLLNVTDEHLYVLPDEEIYQQLPIAKQCRLHGIDDGNQTKAIEESVKDIQPTEQVIITVENDLDDSCWHVTLVRENKEIVNNDVQENEIKV